MFAQKIKQLRVDRGLSQQYLADQLKVQQQTVYKWERGLAYPNIETLKALAKYFNVSIDYLLDNESPDRPCLTDERAKLVNDFEELTPDGQQFILNALGFLLNNSRRAPITA